MKKKIVVALILSFLFCLLLHSAIPVSYASTVEKHELVPKENVESSSKNKEEEFESASSEERSIDQNKESGGINEKESEDVKAMDEPVESFDVQLDESVTHKSPVKARLLDIGIFQDSQFDVQLKDKKLTLTYIGKGLNIRLSDIFFAFLLPNDIVRSIDDSTNIVVKYNGYRQEPPTINEISSSMQLKIETNLLDVIGGLLGFKSELEVEIDLDKPIATTSKELVFVAVADSQSLIDIDLLSNNSNYHTKVISVPESPELSKIYSNTILIKGTLPTDFQSTSTVEVLLPDRTSREATVSNGNFSLKLDEPLAKGTEVQATVTTVDGLMSMPHSVTVQAAPQSLIVPNKLNFGTVTIGSDVTYKFVEEPFQIIVQDTRGTNEQWQLQAHIDQPLTGESGHTLPNALGFHDGNVFIPFITNAPDTQGEAIAIETRTTQSPKEVPISWNPDEMKGPAIKIDHSAVYAEPYQTDITWTLVDGPLP